FNDTANKLRELFQRWNNRTTSVREFVVEKYIDGLATVVCDIEIASMWQENTARVERDDKTIPRLASIIFQSESNQSSKVHDWKQEHVLVVPVKTVQCADGVIPSVVRFYDIYDEVDDLFGGLLYVSTLYGTYKT